MRPKKAPTKSILINKRTDVFPRLSSCSGDKKANTTSINSMPINPSPVRKKRGNIIIDLPNDLDKR